MNCIDYRSRIEDMTAGEKPGADISAHLKACGGCREFLDKHDKLLSILSGMSRVSAPENFSFRLRARIAASSQESSGAFAQPGMKSGLTYLAVLAVLAVGILFGSTLVSKLRQPPSPAGIEELVANHSKPPDASNRIAATESGNNEAAQKLHVKPIPVRAFAASRFTPLLHKAPRALAEREQEPVPKPITQATDFGLGSAPVAIPSKSKSSGENELLPQASNQARSSSGVVPKPALPVGSATPGEKTGKSYANDMGTVIPGKSEPKANPIPPGPPGARAAWGVEGASLRQVSKETLMSYGWAEGPARSLLSKKGLLITSVARGSLASQEGLREGDVLTSVGGQKVNTMDEARACINAIGSGKLKLTFMRTAQSGSMELQIELKSASSPQ